MPFTVATEHVRGSLLLVYPHRFSAHGHAAHTVPPWHGDNGLGARGSRALQQSLPDRPAVTSESRSPFSTALMGMVGSCEITLAWA